MSSLSPTAAFSIAIGDAAVEQARLCRATFKRFHPEIPFYLLDEDLYLWFARQGPIAHAGEIVSLRSIVGLALSRFHGQLLYLDADIVVLDRLAGLLDSPAALTVTADAAQTSYGLGEPVLNAGVLAARGPRFWEAWRERIYSRLTRISANFLDQLALREIHRDGLLGSLLLPEAAAREFYNLGYWDHPGEWHGDGEAAYKGDARIKLWHFGGGKAEAKDWSRMPEPVRQAALRAAEEARPHLDYVPEAERLEALLRPVEADYLAELEGFFRRVPTVALTGVDGPDLLENGCYRSDAPASWDRFRNLEGTGLHRAFSADPPRFFYSPDEALVRKIG